MKTPILPIIKRAEKANKLYSKYEKEDYESGRNLGAQAVDLKKLIDNFTYHIPESFLEFIKLPMATSISQSF